MNFLLGRIEDDLLCTWIETYLSQTKYVKSNQKCVSIDKKSDYSEWYSGLSKSMRQNVRTMYNRLNVDAIDYGCRIYCKQIVASSEYCKLQKLYAKRIGEKMSIGYLKPLLNRLIYLLKINNGFIKALNNSHNSFHSIIYLNGALAAFMSGVVYGDRVIIPHLCYDTNYKRYSPGVLLVSETIKYMSDNNSLKKLDLSCGAEKYKFALGGEEYLLNEYIFTK